MELKSFNLFPIPPTAHVEPFLAYAPLQEPLFRHPEALEKGLYKESTRSCRSEDRCPSQPAHSMKQSWTLLGALCLDALVFHTPVMRWKPPPFSGSRATTMAWHRKSDRNLSLTSSWVATRCWSAQRSVKRKEGLFWLPRWPFLGLLPAELDCRYRPNFYFIKNKKDLFYFMPLFETPYPLSFLLILFRSQVIPYSICRFSSSIYENGSLLDNAEGFFFP